MIYWIPTYTCTYTYSAKSCSWTACSIPIMARDYKSCTETQIVTS